MLAAQALREIGPAHLVKEKKVNVVRAIDQVAERLGNTRAVCRKYYIHPVILTAYQRGEVIPPSPPRPKGDNRKKMSRTLRGDEIAVLRLIERHS
jgi:DNA topoisomerase-1